MHAPLAVVEADATAWLAKVWKTKHENAEGPEFKQFYDNVITEIECGGGQPIEDWAKQRREVKGPDVSSWFDTCGEKPPEGVPIGEWAKARRYAIIEDDIGPFDINDFKRAYMKATAVGPTTAWLNDIGPFDIARAPVKQHTFTLDTQINTQLWAREVLGTDFISKRTLDWFEFAGEVARHIECYTIAQYGDEADDDQANDYTADYCLRQVKKYIERFGRNQRPGQQELDFFKMAHYIQLAMGCYNDEKKNS